jgi:uncharacterized protein
MIMFAPNWTRMAIETPCIKMCTVDAASRTCVGCARTLDEIGRWLVMSPEERAHVMRELPARRAKLNEARVA